MDGKPLKISLKLIEQILTGGLVLFVFLLPWQARWIFAEYSTKFPYYGGLGVFVTDALFVFLLVVWFVWLVARVKSKTFFLPQKQRITLALTFVFVAYTAAASYWSPFWVISAFAWDRLMQAWFLLAMIVTLAVPIRALLVALIAAGSLQSLLALGQFLTQGIAASTWLGTAGQNPSDLGVSVVHYSDQRWLRAYGSLPHPNILGGFLTLGALAASLWHASLYRRPLDQVTALEVAASYGGFAMLMTGLLLTFSRSAWLGFALGWVLLAVAFFQTTAMKDRFAVQLAFAKQVIVSLLILGAFSLIVGPLWTGRVFEQSRVDLISVRERSVLLEQAQGIISDHWVLGTGLAGYLPTLMMSVPGQSSYFYQPVHNMWLLLWAELGLFGLLVFAAWVLLVVAWIKSVFQKKVLSLEQHFSFIALMVIGVMAYLDHFWWTLPFGLFLTAVYFAVFARLFA